MTSGRRVLITGGTGLLGQALLEAAPPGWEAVATFHRTPPAEAWRGQFHRLDVRDGAAVTELVEALRPALIIHAASMGSVEEAERDPDAVRAVNVGGTQAVGQVCGRVGARLVWISSNAVFDGEHPPYAEEAPVRAVNRYGAIKIEAERWVRKACPVPWVVLRPILMYGWPAPGGRGNVVTRWLECLERGEAVEVDARLISMPLLAANCAQAVWAAVTRGRTGVYHVAGADRLALLDFARRVAGAFDMDEGLVRPASERFLSRFAPRPADTSFVTTKMEQELGVRPIGTWEGLAVMQRARAAHRGVT